MLILSVWAKDVSRVTGGHVKAKMTTLHDINRFCNYFEAQVTEVDNLNPEAISEESITQVRLYKKTLIISAIDTLANLRYSKENYKELNKHNKARFTRFVAEYCEWQSGNLISLPYLFDQLTIKKRKDSKLYEVLRKKLLIHDNSGGEFLGIEIIDLNAEELLEFTNSEVEERLIFESQHYSLIHGYKNCIAHEEKDVCGVMEVCQYAEPHYYSYIKNKTSKELTRWHLSYPVEHFRVLFFCGIKNMKRHFIKTNINPYSLIGDSRGHSRWW